MFEPMRARLASSCSRNGISAAATETNWSGRHVHVVDVVRAQKREVTPLAAQNELVLEVDPSSASGALA